MPNRRALASNTAFQGESFRLFFRAMRGETAKEHKTKVHLIAWISLSLTESPVDKLRICRVR